MNLTLPELSLVVLIGPSAAGKSTFARAHFKETEILSSDYCRALAADDENDLAATDDAFAILHFIAGRRLERGRLTVVDATNVQPEARKPLIALARQYHCLPVAIVFDLPTKIYQERNLQRSDRNLPERVIRQHTQQLRRSITKLRGEGFTAVHILKSPEDVEAITIERQPLWSNRSHEHGPFDLIGDVHGCCDELEQLLEQLGYHWQDAAPEEAPGSYRRVYAHAQGRRAVFVGDLVDRGPRILDTYQLVRNMVSAGHALCLPGNHDDKLARKLKGRKVQVNHGMEQSLTELALLPEEERQPLSNDMAAFISGLIMHNVLDDGKLVVAHAGMPQEMQGRASPQVRNFALYGETSGETDEFGLPVRYDWASDYRGRATVVYGHTPVPQAEWLNGTINIDTGCVFGGALTALRYPENELVSIAAARTYAEPIRPLAPAPDERSAQQENDDLLDIADLLGKRIISTRLRPNITVREENSAAALEIISRFAVDPHWLIYLPPTMSPVETSTDPTLLEHPSQAFAHYKKQGLSQLVCEEKHMGSRAVLVLCRDPETAARRFGLPDQGLGIIYTRTGRRFFADPDLEAALLKQIRDGLNAANFWQEFATDWVCLDCELMPWSAKAQELLQNQYAPVGSAARAAFAAVNTVLNQASTRNLDLYTLTQHYAERSSMTTRYIDAYRHYCWPVHSLADLKLAPFHILATEGTVHVDKNHLWHMQTIAAFAAHTPCLHTTAYKQVDLNDPTSTDAAIAWWEELTAKGGEGMVVKPLDFIAMGDRGLLQPAVKCRGREYLRIIYGPEYTAPQHLERLRQRNLSAKRSLALREFALGIEGLERFVSGTPLRQTHECVFAVLALESEPVDPRL